MQTLPPHVQLVQMASAYWVSRLLYVAAKLGLADRLADGPKDAETVAEETDTHAPSLYRVMRTLASLGILTEQDGKRFALTPLGEALRQGAPGSAHASVLTLAGDAVWHGFDHFLYSVETGKSGMEKALGVPIFEYLGQHPDEAALFSETMIGFHGQEPAAIADAYDFKGFATIVDVGGASGHLLTTILGKHAGPRGVLFDLPHGVSQALDLIESRGLGGRVTVETGSFFDRVPQAGDAYLLSHIIHDWSEAQCLTILGNCRDAMKPGGKILIIEMVLPEGDAPHPGKMLDMMMLVGPGGQERTESEYRSLLEKAKLKLVQVIPTQSAVSIVEAIPRITLTAARSIEVTFRPLLGMISHGSSSTLQPKGSSPMKRWHLVLAAIIVLARRL
jgi:hypothetical protein